MINRNFLKINLLILIFFSLVYNADSQHHKVVFANENTQNPVMELQSDKIEISNSYSKASVKGTLNVGGLLGRVSGDAQMLNTYSSGWVEGSGDNFGGLVGSISGNIETIGSYWDIESSGLSQSASGIGRLKSSMTSPGNTNTYEGWNFQQIWHNDINGINGGYPYLFEGIPKMYNLNLLANPLQGGTAKGAGSFARYTHVGISAIPSIGFEFNHWILNGQILSQNQLYIVEMSESDINITANFIQTSGSDEVGQELKIFPNPVNDYIIVKGDSESIKLRITDISGNVLISYDMNEHAFCNISQLLPGYYVVTIINDKGKVKNFPIIKF